MMKNHYHLELETPQGNLVELMQWFQGTYTQRFNCRHELVGHLFQGRYKAVPVDPTDPGHFLGVSNYIHFNPMRAGIVTPPEKSLVAYPWSSYPYIISSRTHHDHWLRKERVLAAIGLANDAAGRAAYRDIMEAKARDIADQISSGEGVKEILPYDSWFAGSKVFGQWLKEVAERLEGRTLPETRADMEPSRGAGERAEALLQDSLAKLGVELEAVRKLRHNDPVKQAVAWWIGTGSPMHTRWISERLRMGHPTNVSRALGSYRRVEDQARRRLRALLEGR